MPFNQDMRRIVLSLNCHIFYIFIAATSVYMYSVENWEPAIVVGFSQVPVKKMDQIEKEFQEANLTVKLEI